MDAAEIPGQLKRSASFLSAIDRRLIARLVVRVPRGVRSCHLTMLTLAWSALAVAGCMAATRNRAWMSGVSGAIFLQYLTDAVDGKLGVVRGEGLVRWGFYMDHLLDYVFFCAIVLGYALLAPRELTFAIMAVFAIAGGFMVSSFLACAVEGSLDISYLRVGPVEVRLLFIAINEWLAGGGRVTLRILLPAIAVVLTAVLVAMVTQVQRRLWRADRADVIHHNPNAVAAKRPAVFCHAARAQDVAPQASHVR